MSQGKQVWKLSPGVRFRRLLDEAVLISPNHSESFVLNDTSASFIERLDGKRTLEEIITGLTGEFEVSASQLSQDLEPLIAELAEKGIIQTL